MGQPRSSQGQNLERSALRASLWLTKLLAFLPEAGRLPKWLRAFLDRRLCLLEQFVADLIMIRASYLHRPQAAIRDRFCVARAGRRHHVRAPLRHSMRAAMGGRLRRALKARGSLKARAEAILRNLQRREKLARACVRRMRRSGLSRRMSAHSGVALLPCRAEALSAKAGLAQILFGPELRVLDTS